MMTPEGKGKGLGEEAPRRASGRRPGETQSWRGEVGRAAAGPLPGGGGSPANSIFHHRLPTPGAPARIAFAVRISKAAPGLFRSGNPILRGVYFSTLENSQCRTDPAPPSPLTPPPAASGRRGRGRGDLRSSARTQDPHSRRRRGARGRAARGLCALRPLPDLGAPLSFCSPAGATIVREGSTSDAQNCGSEGSAGEAGPQRRGESLPGIPRGRPPWEPGWEKQPLATLR